MKNIFFCITPLECLIAKKIINNNFNKNQCELFFFNSISNDIIKHYYEDLGLNCYKSKFYLLNKRFPRYIFDIKNFFKNKKYENVYVSALDSVIIHIALSRIKYKNLITFDDGLGNILKDGIYHKKRKHPFHKRFLYFLLGNRFSTSKIIKSSKVHYTIFKEFENVVSKKPIYIKLFDFKNINKNKKECNVILGTVFSEYYKKIDKKISISKFQKFVSNFKNITFYIKHPREEDLIIENIQKIEKNKIAEEIIAELFKEFEFINLYGFMSTTQFNLISHNNIQHHFILNNEKRVSQGIKLLQNKKIFIHRL
tara:strand:+ start:8078 stop:9010 length:933 start_codon:yes stop_codon:yes gene_type:complete